LVSIRRFCSSKPKTAAVRISVVSFVGMSDLSLPFTTYVSAFCE
jgi:hypothetical protein